MSIRKNIFKNFASVAILSALVLFGCDNIDGLLGGGDNAFAPTKEGTVLTTIRRDSDGNIRGATRTTVKSVNRSGKNMTITTVTQWIDAKGDITNTLEETTNVVDGVTEINLASGLAEALGLPRSAVIGSGILRLPSNMKAGELFGDIRLNVEGINISITNIRCDAIEEITVPAGKFSNAYKMTYNASINISVNSARVGRQAEINMASSHTEWVVKGVGSVKSETVSDDLGNGISELVGLEQDGKPSENRLVIDVTPTDGGTVSLSLEQDVYAIGTIVSLTAEPTQGYILKEWVGAASGNNKTISIAVVGDMNVTAVFEKLNVVQMPDGKMWMAKNLNYVPASGNSWCYDNDESNCERYGRLYDWNTALTICPDGWRLPSDDDWSALVNAIGGLSTAGNKLKSQSGWAENGNGTDDFGFSALPSIDGSSLGAWWTATEEEYDATQALGWVIWNKTSRMVVDGSVVDISMNRNWGNKTIGASVRCIMDDINMTAVSEPRFTNSRDGEVVEYHGNGQRKRVHMFANGLLQRSTIEYFENGRVKSEHHYVNNVLNGPFKTFHPNGRVEEQGTYLNGRLHGYRETFNANGRRLSRATFENGTMTYAESFAD